MANGSLQKIWEHTDLDDQKEVNQAIKDSMFLINPAVEKVWQVNLKVNILFGIIGVCAASTGIVFGVLNIIKSLKG